MSISKLQFKEYIENFDFTKLFNQLGWDYLNETTPIYYGSIIYNFHSVAEKRGFRILVFEPFGNQDLPDYSTRLQLDKKIRKLFREHLIIFCNRDKTIQIWQLFVKQLGKPSRLSETKWYKGQEPELLYQKTSNLFFTIDQDENITITDVVEAVNENFSKNVDKVTKKFYENFRKEHRKFLEFIRGISSIADREWYASLMLNRLMFCYFIQKKGFLDNNINYLKDKLIWCQKVKGEDKFYISFYKNFLLALFHKGLGSPEHPEELKNEIGNIPYLDGGLFDVHELEKQYNNINIDDEAFEGIFNFFDQYNWHLDTRVTASGRDINPDVIGYIFEKYINDRAQMGAYYTKEDITEYISKNCIIPFLFDETERILLKNQGKIKAEEIFCEIWKMLKDSGDTYIYDAVKKGINPENLDFNTSINIDDPNHPLWADLPDEIKNGFRPDLKDKIVVADEEPHLWQLRMEWNKPAPETIALPTEIYRELIERRKRYWELRKKIISGEIKNIRDFITYNLNIRQFAQDVLDNHSNPDFIRYFYHSLNSITILDPTCGSGAFLFAAMNILEPLYESCIQRMENFVDESQKGKYLEFEKILEYIKSPEHPNIKYFVYKSIILCNLYGVDIMKEAVEIAKLRLFLKIVATVDPDYSKPNLGLEPLPDIDFNIRCGNTLIGYSNENELIKSIQFNKNEQFRIGYENNLEIIKEECDKVSRTFKRYKEIQLTTGDNFQDFKRAKEELNQRLKDLTYNFDTLLAKTQYGLNISNKKIFNNWLKTHRPFHWYAEFYEIINEKGGFDVIIGNPPYVKINNDIIYNNFYTFECNNLYTFCVEKSLNLIKKEGWFSMILPIWGNSNNEYSNYRKLILENGSYNAHFAVRPSKLFEGADMNLTITIVNKNINFYTSEYKRWYSNTRSLLFELSPNFFKDNNKEILKYNNIYKISNIIENNILEKLKDLKYNFSAFFDSRGKILYLHSGGRYWKKCFTNETISQNNFSINTNWKKLKINEKFYFFSNIFLNSQLFYWIWITHSDCYTIKDFIYNYIKININYNFNNEKFKNFTEELARNYFENALYNPNYKFKNKFTFKVSKAKPIIDKIDTLLAEYYNLNEEELDFIINYDIKFRMGKDSEEDD